MSSFFDDIPDNPAPFTPAAPQTAPAPPEAKVDVAYECEKGALSEIILGGVPVYHEAVKLGVTADHFFHEDSRWVFRLIEKRVEEGKQFDPLVINDAIRRESKDTSHHLFQHFLTLTTANSASWMLAEYARSMVEAHERRSIQAKVASIASEVSGGSFDPKSVRLSLAEAAQHMTRAATSRRSIKDHVKLAYERADFIMKGGMPSGVRAPFREMARLLPVIEDGRFVLIAGRPSAGKTSMLLSAAVVNAMEFGENAEKKVMICTLESPAEQIVDRIVQILAEVNIKDIASFDVSEQKAFTTAMVRLSRLPIIIEHEHAMRIDSLCAAIERAVREDGVRVVYVDYAERILSTLRETAPGAEKMQQIAVRLSILSKKLMVPIILAAQLSRECEKENRRPRLSDLGMSGALEKEADIVVMIWKPKADMFERDAVEMSIAIEKNRDGPTGPFKLMFYRWCTKYLDKPFEPPPDVAP